MPSWQKTRRYSAVVIHQRTLTKPFFQSVALISDTDGSINAQDGEMALKTNGDLQLDIKRRIEMGKLAEMFLGPIGKYIFYLIIIVRHSFSFPH